MLMLVVFGIGSTVVDVGNAYQGRRGAQNAADAAALAGAGVYADGQTLNEASARAKQVAALTLGYAPAWAGCADSGALPTIAPTDVTAGNACISFDPPSGRVRVRVVARSVRTTFATALGRQTLPVVAIAEAVPDSVGGSSGGPGGGSAAATSGIPCALCAMGTGNGEGVATIDMNGSANPWNISGGVHTNGTMKIQEPSVLNVTPLGALSLGMPPIQCSNVHSTTCPPPYITTPTTIPDPLAFLPDPPTPATPVAWPCPSGCSVLSPGTYRGPFNFNSGTVYLLPGNYIFTDEILAVAGTLAMHPSAGPTDGVTLFFVGSSYMELRPSGSLQLRAPTTGPYAGVLVYYGRTKTDVLGWRGSKNSATGTIYAPAARLRFDVDSPWSSTSRFIAGTVSNQDTGITIVVDDSTNASPGSATPPATTLHLVE